MTRIEPVFREIETPDGTIRDYSERFGGAVVVDPLLIAQSLELPPDAVVHWEMERGKLVISFECYRWRSDVTPENHPTYLGMGMFNMPLNAPHCWDRIIQLETTAIKTHRQWQIEHEHEGEL